MCAGIAALENDSDVTILEKASETLSGGNTKYTAGAMRFCFDGIEDLTLFFKIQMTHGWKILYLVVILRHNLQMIFCRSTMANR